MTRAVNRSVSLREDGIIPALFRLQDLPGYFGRSFGRKLRRRLQRQTDGCFAAMLERLGPGSVCVDFGANVGLVTRRLAETGATVHAIEPDPVNFDVLAESLRDLPNVTLHRIAVGQTSGTMRLFRPVGGQFQPGDMSSQGVTGHFRPGVSDADNSFEVEVVGLDAFFDRIGGRADLVKMDIEGGELPLLEAVVVGQLTLRCDALFVETHENQYPDEWARVRALRHAFRGASAPFVSLYWI